jgi:uncharacterized LabA/DUF88 family protein
MPRRAAFYIDGFNLYHSIQDLQQPHLKWFSVYDYAAFIAKKNGEDLAVVRYFSALATHRQPSSVARHQTYLRALKSTGVEYVLGQFKGKSRKCLNCSTTWIAHEEKETDVNIAVQIIEDAIDGRMDACYIVSGDTDLAPPIRLLKRKFPQIEYICVSPPGRRHPGELLALADRTERMTATSLQRNRLPPVISDSTGIFSCPSEYDLPT